MNTLRLMVILVCVVVMANQSDAWRRRRRRRTCSAVHCAMQWGSWSACNCYNTRSRTTYVARHPSCGGASCPSTQRQLGQCNGGQCVVGGGNCVNGRCQCVPGRRGTRCESTCPSGKYGQNCANTCTCMSGIACDPKDGFCKCPVGRSGKRCQYHYRCMGGSGVHCYHMTNSIIDYKSCFVQLKVSYHPTNVKCPSPTHYVNKCRCYPNCTPVSMYNSRYCRCQCKAPNTASTPAIARNRYVTYATCCPMGNFY